MPPNEPTAHDQLGALDGLAAVDAARESAVDSTRHPRWLFVALSLCQGIAFGFVLLRTTAGWITGASIFVVAMVAFLILNARVKRRRGRLLHDGKWSSVRFFAVFAAIFIIGQIRVPGTWQPWFAIGAGVFFALLSYGYLVWEDAAMSRRLASGDFSASDLMP